MTIIKTSVDINSQEYIQNYNNMQVVVDDLRVLLALVYAHGVQ